MTRTPQLPHTLPSPFPKPTSLQKQTKLPIQRSSNLHPRIFAQYILRLCYLTHATGGIRLQSIFALPNRRLWVTCCGSESESSTNISLLHLFTSTFAAAELGILTFSAEHRTLANFRWKLAGCVRCWNSGFGAEVGLFMLTILGWNVVVVFELIVYYIT